MNNGGTNAFWRCHCQAVGSSPFLLFAGWNTVAVAVRNMASIFNVEDT
jgi:hypothetical protein